MQYRLSARTMSLRVHTILSARTSTRERSDA